MKQKGPNKLPLQLQVIFLELFAGNAYKLQRLHLLMAFVQEKWFNSKFNATIKQQFLPMAFSVLLSPEHPTAFTVSQH
jgi:hypothetical protein